MLLDGVVTLSLFDENWVSSASLLEASGVWLEGTLGRTESGTSSDMTVRAAFKVILAGKIGTDWLRGGFEAKSACSGGQI